MRLGSWLSLAILVLAGALAAPAQGTQAPDPQVRGVFFYSPQCPHCHDVMRDHFPPLFERYGEALRLVAVNVDTREGQALYRAVVDHFRLPRERLGVPALVVGDRVLVGAWEIPTHLPGLVDAGLAGTGVDWPAIPEVRSFLALQGIAAGPSVELEGWMVGGGAAAGEGVVRVLGQAGEGGGSSVAERVLRDPLGNAIAIIVLLGMVAVLGSSIRAVSRPRGRLTEWPGWVIPALAAAGVAVALYMAFVEVTGAEAVCGPVGDCNAVQMSPYAFIAGVPVGVLGIVGYLVLGGLWVAGLWLKKRPGAPAGRGIPLLVWGMAAAGVAFSIYLTFLEPFVIGATCIWCITSALIMTLILVAATPPAANIRKPAMRGRNHRRRARKVAATSRT